MLALLLPLALAAEPTPPIEGFDRLHVDPAFVHVEPERPVLPPTRATLVIPNGHGARASVRVGELPIGELLPRATGTLHDVLAGTYQVSFHLPGGIVRTAVIAAVPPAEPHAD